MIIVAFLQNQWFKDPERIKRIYAARPDRREELNKRFLFLNSLTGKRLKATFGDMCNLIIWEEISPRIGRESAAVFSPDHDHIKSVLEKHKPDCLIAFGTKAKEGLKRYCEGIPLIDCPHPAARRADTMQRLCSAAMLLEDKIKESKNG